MLNYTDLKPGTHIVVDGQPYRVVEYNFSRVQQRKPVVQTKIKNLISGKTVEKGFTASDKIEEANIAKKNVKYLYNKPARGGGEDEFWFCEEDNPGARFQLSSNIVDEAHDLMKTNSIVEAITFGEDIIGIDLPPKIDLKVTEAPPSIKGNTVSGGSKPVKVETGATINAPLFINTGDVIKINTQTREYAERVEKA